MSDAIDPRLTALSTLLHVEQQARQAESQQNLSFIFVNDTRSVLPARQIVFWRFNDLGAPRTVAASHVSEVDPNAILTRWLDKLAAWAAAQEWHAEPHAFTRGEVAEELQQDWGETLPAYVLHLPMAGQRKGAFGGLLVFGEQPWGEAHLALARILADAYGHAWMALAEPETRRKLVLHFRQYWRRYVLALVVLCLLPLRQYVLVPAEVIADQPAVIAAPLGGVIERVVVQPNQQVAAGDLLFVYENIELANRLLVAQRAYDVAEAEHLKNTQEAFNCDACRGKVAQSQAVVERERANVEWAKKQLEQGEVRAPRAGVVVMGDTSDWEGRPVRVGERVMLVADPARTRLRITVPITDAIASDTNTEVVFYPNVSPLSSVDARVVSAGYEPVLQPDRSYAYVVHAAFEGESAPLGWRGTAKVYGGRAPLIYQMLRKPLARLRQMTGL